MQNDVSAMNSCKMFSYNEYKEIVSSQSVFFHDDDSDVKIYTDGSGMEGKIGAAAVLYRNGRAKTNMHYKLGTQGQHTVYEGEGVGAVMGVRLIAKEWGVQSATICIDSQAVIKATQLTKPSPGHYILDTFHDNIDTLKKKHPGI